MLKCEVISIGTELLMGQIVNTDAQYISSRLPECGVGVFYHSVIGDNPGRIKEALKIGFERCDVVITTGGLDPTQDDLTKEIVADFLGLKLVLDDRSSERIRKYFEDRGRVLVESNLRQAYFPEGSIIVENDMGTAPGCIVEKDDKVIVMLPGPPKELIPMFDKVMKYFKEKQLGRLFSKYIRIVGMGESMVEQKIYDIVSSQTNPTIATYAKDGIVTIRVTASNEGGSNPEVLVNDMVNKICEILGDNVYTTENDELEYVVFKLLKERNLKIATAESCSGGVLAQLLTSIPGSSHVFHSGFVTYSEESKIRALGVERSTIETYSAVSSQTAREMADGACRKTGCDVGVSITGYAGPDGESVGLVYIGVSYGGATEVSEFRFSGNRERIRTMSAVTALDMVRRTILNKS